MGYTLTRIKTFTGREGQGLNAVIERDGKPIAFVLDQADGGDVDIDFRNPLQTPKSYQASKDSAAAEEKAFAEFCEKWYVESGEEERDRKRHAEWNKGSESPTDFTASEHDKMVDWVNHFVDDIQAVKQIKKALAKKICFTKKGKPGIWTMKAMPADVLAKWLADPALTTKLNDCETVLNLLPVDEAVKVWVAKDHS